MCLVTNPPCEHGRRVTRRPAGYQVSASMLGNNACRHQAVSAKRRECIGERRIPPERGERLGILVGGTQKCLGKRYGTRR
jgi:hypothetical protein